MPAIGLRRARVLGDQVLHEQRDVLAALAQRRTSMRTTSSR
jgi:hypothetical protein